MEPHINQNIPKIDLNPVTFLKDRESGKIGRTAAVRPKGIYIPSDRIWGETKVADFSPYTRFSWKSKIDIEGTRIYNGAIITDNHTTIHTYDEPVIITVINKNPRGSTFWEQGSSSTINNSSWEEESSPTIINNSSWEEESSPTISNWDTNSWDSANNNWDE